MVDDLPGFDGESAMEEGGRKRDFGGTNDTFLGVEHVPCEPGVALWLLRQPAPPLEFSGEQGMFTDMYGQVREEEQVISLQFTCSQQDASKRRRKKRKQVDDGTAIV